MPKYSLIPLLVALSAPTLADSQRDDRAAPLPEREAALAAAPVTPAVPAADAPLLLSTPLEGNLSTVAVVGLGAAAVAVGAAISNSGGGSGHGGGSGTTGTTR
ncbi:hypothetical protein [Pseudomonas citronellolis]|uniref:hypothetical protein n=1 Tax=Pseudomonas citronellolis TaxID=53408 RepID=UPI0023E378C7|nr:hypothetical protein [Pseudomonas citronellolis]MDF3935660.1 hypothetical protein [Pseudomonas citronellolis]